MSQNPEITSTEGIRKLVVLPAFQSLWQTTCRFWFADGGRGGGKSIAVADWILEKLRTEREIIVLCTREIQKSIKDSVYALLRERAIETGISEEFDFVATEIRHKVSKSYIIFAGLREHTVDSIKSYQSVKYCWVEEAHAISEKSLRVLIPTIRVKGSRILFTYNRFAENDPVHKLRKREIKRTQRIMWQWPKVLKHVKSDVLVWHESSGKQAYGVTANYDSNPYFPDALLNDMLNDKKENEEVYNHVWKGEPVAQAAFSIISRKKALAAIARHIPLSAVAGLQRDIGIDVARYGDDSTIFAERQGMKSLRQVEYNKLGIDQTADLASRFANDEVPRLKIDDTGLGGGVTDILTKYGYKAYPVNFGASPKNKKKYPDVISEMWFEFAAMIDEVDLPDDRELYEQITERQWYMDRSQRRCVESKADFKKRYGKSPDKADAWLLAFYEAKYLNKRSASVVLG